MTPTDKLRTKLRRLLDEVIPDQGTDKDTRFLDSEIDDLLEESRSIYEAAALGWTEKAGMFQREMAGLEQTSTGQESYRYTSLRDRLAYALKMAETYSALGDTKSGFLMKVQRPEVL